MSGYTHLNLKDAEDQAPYQEEVYVLVNGKAQMKIEDEVKELEQWDAVRVHKDTMRSLEAGGEGAEFLIVGAPNTGPGDAETVQGWWSD